MVKLELRHFNATEETTTMANDRKTLGKVVQIDVMTQIDEQVVLSDVNRFESRRATISHRIHSLIPLRPRDRPSHIVPWSEAGRRTPHRLHIVMSLRPRGGAPCCGALG